jgi:hypothetical protein
MLVVMRCIIMPHSTLMSTRQLLGTMSQLISVPPPAAFGDPALVAMGVGLPFGASSSASAGLQFWVCCTSSLRLTSRLGGCEDARSNGCFTASSTCCLIYYLVSWQTPFVA